MANIVLKLKDIEDLFQNIILLMLSLDPALPENQDIVRISWPPAGAPGWKISQDRIFLKVTLEDDDYDKLVDTDYVYSTSSTANQIMSGTNVIAVNIVAYGPNSFDNMNIIRNSFNIETYKNKLKAKNIYRVINTKIPMRIPELYNGQWWDRSDLTIHFNSVVSFGNIVNYINSASAIIKK